MKLSRSEIITTFVLSFIVFFVVNYLFELNYKWLTTRVLMAFKALIFIIVTVIGYWQLAKNKTKWLKDIWLVLYVGFIIFGSIFYFFAKFSLKKSFTHGVFPFMSGPFLFLIICYLTQIINPTKTDKNDNGSAS